MNRIDRIRSMEERLDRAGKAVEDAWNAIEGYNAVLNDIKVLETYYISKQWMRDLEADEAGKLPADLKRGVLSEDGIFDLLEEAQGLNIELAETLTRVIKKSGF